MKCSACYDFVQVPDLILLAYWPKVELIGAFNVEKK